MVYKSVNHGKLWSICLVAIFNTQEEGVSFYCSRHVRESKTALDSGIHAVDSGSHVLDSGI